MSGLTANTRAELCPSLAPRPCTISQPLLCGARSTSALAALVSCMCSVCWVVKAFLMQQYWTESWELELQNKGGCSHDMSCQSHWSSTAALDCTKWHVHMHPLCAAHVRLGALYCLPVCRLGLVDVVCRVTAVAAPAAGGGLLISGSADGIVRVWNGEPRVSSAAEHKGLNGSK